MEKADLKILIVDNMTYIRILVEKVLRDMGFSSIRHAGNGEQALEILKQYLPDLVILDLTLPKINALTLINIFLTLNKNAKIIVSGDTENAAPYEEAIEKGAVDFFIKPVIDKILKEKITSIYNKLATVLDNQRDRSTEDADITKRFDINLNSKKLVQVFNFSRTLDKINFIDMMQAVIACQMYNYKNLILDFGNISTLYIDAEDLIELKDTIEQEGGKFCIISNNNELTKTLAKTDLFEYIAKTPIQAEKRIS